MYGGEYMTSRKEIISNNIKLKRRKQLSKSVSTLNVSILLLSSAMALSKAMPTQVLDNQDKIVEARTTPSNFIGKITKYATDIASKNDLYASVMIAQAALESAWGNSGLTTNYNNLFGIKGSYNGNSVQLDTLEDDGSGRYYTSKEGFRVYDNWGQSLEDYASVLTGDNNPNSWRYKYYKGARVSNTQSYKDATSWLTGRYATDTSYNTKLNKLINDYNLTQYDGKKSGSIQTSDEAHKEEVLVQGETTNQTSNKKANGTYSVKAGDSVWKIASMYGMTLDQVRQLNNLSGNFIHPGQVLKVNSKSEIQPTNNSSETVNVSTDVAGSPIKETSTNHSSYKVSTGDSLWAIASKNGMTLNELKTLNNLSSNFIYPGQSLKVGTSQTKNQKPESSEGSSPVSQNSHTQTKGTYTVQPGDSVWKIAQKFGVSMDQLSQQNNLSGYTIHPGQSLVISGSKVSVTKDAKSSNPSTPNTQNVDTTNSASYKVKAGDSVWRVAANHGISADHLRQLNNISGNFIYPGQVLKVAGQAPKNNIGQTKTTPIVNTVKTNVDNATDSNQPKPTTPASNANGHYIVNKNDSLYRIAVNHGISLDELIQKNGFSGPNQLILPGQTVIVK